MIIKFGPIHGTFNGRRLIGYVILVLAFTFLGAFGTYENMDAPSRFLYWAILIAGIGMFMTFAGDTILEDKFWPSVPRLVKAAIASAIAALPSAGLIWTTERVLRGYQPGYLAMWFYVAIIGFGMLIIHHQLWRPPAKPYAPFFKRLPGEIGTDLMSLSMADHYVEVKTQDGSTMVLMRFADALKELSGYPGHQIHRSHWVADKYVIRLERQGARNMAVLSDGSKLPVSKAYLDDVRSIVESNEAERLEQIEA